MVNNELDESALESLLEHNQFTGSGSGESGCEEIGNENGRSGPCTTECACWW